MITIKNRNISEETINAINELIEKEINVKAAFRLSRIVKEIATIVETAEDMKKKIFDKYAIKDSDGNYEKVYNDDGTINEGAVKISDPEAYNKDMVELMEVETTLDYNALTFDELGLEKINTKTMLSLEFLFQD